MIDVGHVTISLTGPPCCFLVHPIRLEQTYGRLGRSGREQDQVWITRTRGGGPGVWTRESRHPTQSLGEASGYVGGSESCLVRDVLKRGLEGFEDEESISRKDLQADKVLPKSCLSLIQDPYATFVPFVKAIVKQHPELGVSVHEAFPKLKVVQVDSLSDLLSHGHAGSSSSTSTWSKHSRPGPAWKLTRMSERVS